MARSRSRSPGRRDRRRSRSRSRERERDRERRRERHRSRSRSLSPRGRSPRRHRSRSPRRRSWSRSPRRRSRDRSDGSNKVETRGAVPKFLLEKKPITEKDLEGKTEEEQDMLKTMGFSSFDSTKGKHVPGNSVYGVHIIHKRKYRQYMNRKGGFNRPLDFVA